MYLTLTQLWGSNTNYPHVTDVEKETFTGEGNLLKIIKEVGGVMKLGGLFI